MTQFQLADLFEAAADRVPSRPALISGDRTLTFAELDERATRLANVLSVAGITRGDHIGVVAMNGHEWVECLLGCFKVGVVPINVNYRYTADECRYLFDNADLVGIIYQDRYEDVVFDAAPAARDLRLLLRIETDGARASSPRPASAPEPLDYEAALAGSSAQRPTEGRSPDDLYILYTGGTTGMPKGVMWRHEDVFFTLGGGFDIDGKAVASPTTLAERAAEGFNLTYFVLPPLMHGAGQWGTLRSLFEGHTIVLSPAPSFDPEAAWATVARDRVNVIIATGDAMARPLVETLAADVDRFDTSSLLAFGSTAAIFSRAVKNQFFELLPNIVLTDSIGSTETGFSGLAQVTKDTDMKAGPTVVPGAETIVVDDDMNPLRPGTGQTGRIARSGHVPLGYYKDPEKTAATFPIVDGVRYVIPGDFAVYEADGTITLLGRGSQCINTGGEKVYPEEVEAILKEHPDVFDVLVVGVPDDRFGQRVAAVVQARAGTTPTLESLGTHCRTQLAGYKLPRTLVLVDVVPRLPNAKPDYREAKRVAEAAAGSTGA